MKRIFTFYTFLVALLGLLSGAQAQTCAAPTNVVVNSVGSPGNTTAVVSFTPSATALSYTVRYFWIGDSTTAGMMTVNTTTSPITLTGLRTGAGAFYRVSVVSNCAGGFTTPSPWTGFQVGGSGGPGPGTGSCGTVTGLFISSSSTVTYVGFIPVAGALSYTVRFQAVGDSTGGRTMTITSSPAAFTGALLPSTQYVATVVTNCANGASSATATMSFTTPAAPNTSCGAVTNVHANSAAATPTTATLSFTPVAGALSYTVRYYAAHSSTVQTLTTTSSPVTITGLQPGTFYDADIFTNCASGVSATSGYCPFSTTTVSNCGPVTNVTITATSASTATVSFTPGAGNSGFYISWGIPQDSIFFSTYTTSTAPVTLTGLIPGRTYTVQVQSICGVSGQTTNNTTGPISYSFRGALASQAAIGTGMLSVFPNPAHHTASLVVPAVPGVAQAKVLLLNALGQQVRTIAVPLGAASETRTQLDLSGVAPGLYTLRVQAGEQSASQRLAVE